MGAILESYQDPSKAMLDGYSSELARAAMTAANAMVIEELRLAKEEKERRERGCRPLYPIATL
jgi:hypothetical protein